MRLSFLLSFFDAMQSIIQKAQRFAKAVFYFIIWAMDCVGKIVDLIAKAHDKGKTYVFSSQVIARSYLEAYARIYPNVAIFSDTVISWDDFKSNFSAYPKTKTRAVFTDRLIFVQQFFAKENALKRLHYYCDSAYPCSQKAYIQSIAKGLPNMCHAFDVKSMTIKDNTLIHAPSDMVYDLKILVPAYKSFLDENNLYDTCLYTPDFTSIGDDGKKASDYVLVFSNTFKDALVNEALKICKSVDFDFNENSSENEVSNSKPKLKLFANSICETKALMRKVHELLLNGELPNDIAISCPFVASYLPYLEQEASKRDIVLGFTDTKPLITYIPGRFFSTLLKIRDENYSFESMKNLLLEPCFPYKDRALMVLIIEKAIKCKLQDGPLVKWAQRFTDIHEEELAKTVLEIGSKIETVVNCTNVNSLHDNIMRLVNYLFGENTWVKELSNNDSPEDLNARVFGSCITELDSLSAHSSLLEANGTQDLFGLFIDILGDKVYTPNLVRNVVKVYSYPVDAGIAVKHHFVMGLTDTNTRTLRNPYPFLPYEKVNTIEDVLHLEETLLSHYENVVIKTINFKNDTNSTNTANPTNTTNSTNTANSSNVVNSTIWLSSSQESFSGADVVPTSFLGENCILPVNEIKDDSFIIEEKLWEDLSAPKSINCNLANSLKNLAQNLVISQKQKDCLLSAYEGPLNYDKNLQFNIPKLPLCINVSRIKAFEECPFKGYVYCVLKLQDVDYKPKMNDAAQIGDILHSTIQKALKEAGSLSNINEARLKSIFRNELANYSQQPTSTDISHITYIKKNYEDILPLVYETKTANSLQEMHFKAMENDTSFTISDGVISLKGRADCILEDDDGNYAVIDFKKNASSYYSKGDLNKISLQLAIYAKMMEQNPKFGKTPKYGAFYSIEEGTFKYVWPKMDFGRSKPGFEYSCNEHNCNEHGCNEYSCKEHSYNIDSNSNNQETLQSTCDPSQDNSKDNSQENSQNSYDLSQEYVDENYKMRIEKLKKTVSNASFIPTPSDDSCRNCNLYNLCRGGFETV